MPRYPKGSRRPQKPWKGTTSSVPSVIGEPTFSTINGPLKPRDSHNQTNRYESDENSAKAKEKIRQLLTSIGVQFDEQYTLSEDHVSDFFLVDLNMVIDLDEPHHEKTSKRGESNEQDIEWNRNGILLAHFTNCDVLNSPFRFQNELLKKIRDQMHKNNLRAPKVDGVSRVKFSEFDDALSHLR